MTEIETPVGGSSDFPVDFPVDCLGIVIEYIDSSVTFQKLLISCKHYNHYIEVVNPGCCRYVNFHFKNYVVLKKKRIVKKRKEVIKRKAISKRKVSKKKTIKPIEEKPTLLKSNYSYVFNLTVEGPKPNEPHRMKSPLFVNDSILFFPNLEKLNLIRVNEIDFNLFQNTPNLLILSIENCVKLVGNVDFSGLKRLRTLKYDCSHLSDRFLETGSWLLDLKNLEKLELCMLFFKKVSFKDFENLEKMIVLRMKQVQYVNGKIFQFMKNLEVVDLQECNSFHFHEFKYLKKVDDLRIDDCEDLYDKNDIVKEMGLDWKPKRFVFIEPSEMMGDDCSDE